MGPENQEAPNVLEDHFYPLPGLPFGSFGRLAVDIPALRQR